MAFGYGADPMRVRFADVAANNAATLEASLSAIRDAAVTGEFILGAPVRKFETATCEYLRVRHAVGVSSGSDALVCALAPSRLLLATRC
jgi:dTDP-4-amino-4,6-dideoxygalactose transaminase